MKEKEFKKTEYYLYNYRNINKLIEEIRENIIDSVNVGVYAHLKSKNTIEEQAIKLVENKKVYYLKKVKLIIEHYLKTFKDKNPKRYKFIKMKYFDKSNSIEIEKALGYNDKQQKDITNMVVSFFYRQFKKAGIGGI